jgi:hypothetical protein
MIRFVKLTRSFESWFAKNVPYVVRADQKIKHQNMSANLFLFFRAVCYAYIVRFYVLCRDLIDGVPLVSSIVDIHVDNFGSWRDLRSRLCWGVNDFDEAKQSKLVPYTFDLVRLATSAKCAIADNHLKLKPRKAYEAILEGYMDMLKQGGRGFVLEEEHPELRLMVMNKLKEPGKFWDKMTREIRACNIDKFPQGLKVLKAQLPEDVTTCKIGQRTAGQGSLGIPRLDAMGHYEGGLIAHEVKVARPSALVWAGVTDQTTVEYNEIVAASFRSRDPFLGVINGITHRRLSPDCSRVELSDLPEDRDEYLLLRSMGAEIANVHLGTGKNIAAVILKDLAKREPEWIRTAVKKMFHQTAIDQEEWVEHIASKR